MCIFRGCICATLKTSQPRGLSVHEDTLFMQQYAKGREAETREREVARHRAAVLILITGKRRRQIYFSNKTITISWAFRYSAGRCYYPLLESFHQRLPVACGKKSLYNVDHESFGRGHCQNDTSIRWTGSRGWRTHPLLPPPPPRAARRNKSGKNETFIQGDVSRVMKINARQLAQYEFQYHISIALPANSDFEITTLWYYSQKRDTAMFCKIFLLRASTLSICTTQAAELLD